MSVVIDGKDILADTKFLSICMSERLESLLAGKKEDIPEGVLSGAKNLFSIAMDHVRNKKGLSPIRKNTTRLIEPSVTYRLLTDMLKVAKKDIKDVDSELEKIAIALEVLTPDGRQIFIAKEHYQTLQSLFKAMYNESNRYSSHYGGHSPYSVGAFDNDDE
jgi:hypothetical protein